MKSTAARFHDRGLARIPPDGLAGRGMPYSRPAAARPGSGGFDTVNAPSLSVEHARNR